MKKRKNNTQKNLKRFKNFQKDYEKKLKTKYYKPIRTKGAFNNDCVKYESREDKDKNLLPKDYIDIIRPFLRDMINNNRTYGEWKIQLIMRINFISSLDTDEFRTMHTKSDNIEIMNGTETNVIINELFESFLKRYQEGLETKMKGSEFIFESVDLLYYSLHKISLNRGGSYMDSSSWIKNKRATINPKSADGKCF